MVSERLVTADMTGRLTIRHDKDVGAERPKQVLYMEWASENPNVPILQVAQMLDEELVEDRGHAAAVEYLAGGERFMFSKLLPEVVRHEREANAQ